jgi:hypothetical protein
MRLGLMRWVHAYRYRTNRGGTPTVLLRKSYRENGKTKKQTVANLSELAPEQIEQMRAILRSERLLPAAQAIEIVRSLPHGHVLAALRQPMPAEIARLVDAAETAARIRDERRLHELLVALLRPLSLRPNFLAP